jgi:hypothetical protein
MEDRDRWIKRRAPSSRNGSLEKGGSFSGAESLAALLSGDETSSTGPLQGTPRSGVSSAASPEASAAGSMEERDEEDDSLEVDLPSLLISLSSGMLPRIN